MVDCNNPVVLGPSRSPTCSMACPTRAASCGQGQAREHEPGYRPGRDALSDAGDDREYDDRAKRDPVHSLEMAQVVGREHGPR